MATPTIPDSTAVVQFAQISDTMGRLFLLPRAAAEALFSGATTEVTVVFRRGETSEPHSRDGWLSVSEAAALLISDNTAANYAAAKTSVSMGARRGHFAWEGEGVDRRIDPTSFDAWRLARRDRANDREDAHS